MVHSGAMLEWVMAVMLITTGLEAMSYSAP